MGTWDVPGRPSRRPRLSPGLLRRHLHAPGPISTPFSTSADLVFDAPVYTGARFSKKLPGRLLESKKLRKEGFRTRKGRSRGCPGRPRRRPRGPRELPEPPWSVPGTPPEHPRRSPGAPNACNRAPVTSKRRPGTSKSSIRRPPGPHFGASGFDFASFFVCFVVFTFVFTLSSLRFGARPGTILRYARRKNTTHRLVREGRRGGCVCVPPRGLSEAHCLNDPGTRKWVGLHVRKRELVPTVKASRLTVVYG